MRFKLDKSSSKFIGKLKNVLLLGGTFVILVLIIEALSFSQSSSNDDTPFNQAFKVFPVPMPDTMSFAGETVPMNHLGVREGLEQEMLVHTYWQSQAMLMLKRTQRYFPVIEDILKRYSIPNDFKYLALAESAFSYKPSPAGAVGFWQLMRYTAEAYNLEINREVDERYNLVKSTEAACKYFRDAYAVFHNWTLAAASYNMGIEGLRKELEKEKEGSYYDLSLNLETSRYLYRILSLKLLVSSPSQYGFYLKKQDMYQPIPSYTVSVDSTISSLADFASQYGISFHTLKF
ncbi:MAG TPA: lytic transglycosylase domain-containing protein, partial [Bacteroidia bacterium]|nr:lytic transglycosylase domain-containing protein [Bacteroidia bacterium]